LEGSVVRVTLSLVGPGIITIFVVPFIAAWLLDRKKIYLLMLSGSCVLFAIGAIMQVLYWPRDTGLNALTSAAFYTVAVLSAVEGILRRSNQSIGKPLMVTTIVLIIGLLWYFFYVDRNLLARIYVQNFGYGAVFLFAAWKLSRNRTKRITDDVLFWTLLLFGAQFFPRTLLTAGVTDPITPMAFADTVFWQALQLSVAVLGVALALAVLSAAVTDMIGDLTNERDRDYLTGLLNRRGFEAAIKTKGAEKAPCALIVCDVDWFKSINDEFGHLAGDAVLKRIASVLSKAARRQDIVGRLGGEEFAVYLRDVSPDDAYDCAERLRIAVRSTDFSDILGSRHLTASFGVAAGKADWSHMYKMADAFLYEAKESGRNQTIVGLVKPF